MNRQARLEEHFEYLDKHFPDMIELGKDSGLVLDIGPGEGELLEIARALGYEILGIDASSVAGMGYKYLRYSKLMHERQGIPVYYNGLGCWLKETQNNLEIRSTFVFINMRGSIEQCFAEHLVGVPHDEHHKATDMNWRCTGETQDAFAHMFRVFFLLLRPNGRVVIHANGTGAAVSQKWYDNTIQRAAYDAGLKLHARENNRLHSWVKTLNWERTPPYDAFDDV